MKATRNDDVNDPRFWFMGSGFQDGFRMLTEPDDRLVLDSSGGTWFRSGQEVGGTPSIPDAIDRFFSGHDSGIVAGWISYDAGLLMREWELNKSKGYTHLPVVYLAHYPRRKNETSFNSVSELDHLEWGTFRSDRSKRTYEKSIKKIKNLIRRGYIYQLNYSQRFSTFCEGSFRSLLPVEDSFGLPPQSVYFNWKNHEVLSLSPERFFRVDGEKIITQPIKGTSSRSSNSSEDREYANELRESPKDQAEHHMIVDLERNDLNRICKIGSVHVPELRKLYTFPTVHHLISTIKGRLKDHISPGQIFRNIFPGGSITGAPKEISIRLINHIERRRRGIYTGTIGYWDLDRELADWNISIRTLVKAQDQCWWDAGGGIVIDSDAEDEFSESLDKVNLLKKIRSNDSSNNKNSIFSDRHYND